MKISRRLVGVAIITLLAAILLCFGFARGVAAPQVEAAQDVNQQSENQPGLQIEEIDPRYENLKQFFDKYKCPEPRNIDVYIQTADKYDIDYRLLPAISVKESTCGKHVPHWCPKALLSHNHWGYQTSCYKDAASGIENVLYEIRNESPWKKSDGDVKKILWTYNGTVEPGYPARVINLMNQIEKIGTIPEPTCTCKK